MKSKLFFVFVLALFSLSQAIAQNGNCGEVFVNVKKGTINKVKPTAPMEKVQEIFPCFTGVTKEDEGYNCGGGVFFIKNDFYAYTGRDYWEIRSTFKGSWDTKLLGCKPADIEFQYGDPIREERIPGFKVAFFKMKYGCIRIQYGIASGRSEEIGIHYKPAAEVELCY